MAERDEAIRARCEAATPGPWYSGDGSVDRFFAGKNTVATRERVIVERATYNDEYDQQTYDDIAFTAHAREDVPYLLSEKARLESALVEAQRRAEAAEAQLKQNSVFMAVHGAGGYVMDVPTDKVPRAFGVEQSVQWASDGSGPVGQEGKK